MNLAIELLKDRKKDLVSRKRHNDRIRKELSKQRQVWKEQGIDDELIAGREVRFFGDPMPYNGKLHKDINSLLKYLSVEDFK